MKKKKILLLSAVTLLCFWTPAIAQNGFYTINYVTDHLVFVDTLGIQTDIGYTGRDINTKKIGLAFHNNGTLYNTITAQLILQANSVTSQAETATYSQTEAHNKHGETIRASFTSTTSFSFASMSTS